MTLEFRDPPAKNLVRPPLPSKAPRRAAAGLDTPSGVVGHKAPRIATQRPTGASQGNLVATWATTTLGVDLLPWQLHALDEGLVQTVHGRWASRTVAIMVGRQNGKTMLTAVRALAGMTLWGEEVLAASANRDVALDAWMVALELAEDAELGVHSVHRTNGREEFSIGRSRYKVVSNTRAGGRGLTGDLVILDEVREYRTWDGWAALEKTRRAKPSSQVWAISNEGDDASVVLCSLAERGRNAALTGEKIDLAWMEWSAPPDAMRSDPEAWAAANPALGYLITEDTIRSEAAIDDPAVFETEVLCRRVASLRPWLAEGTWEACMDWNVQPPADDSDVIFALDAGPELRHASIAVAHKREDGSCFVETVAGFSEIEGEVLPRAAIRLAELVDTWKPAAVYVMDKGQSQAAAGRVLELQPDTRLVSLNGADLIRAAQAFHEAVVARLIVHPDDKITGAHLGGLSADGVLRRRSQGHDVDAAVAAVLAAYGATHTSSRQPVQDWVAF